MASIPAVAPAPIPASGELDALLAEAIERADLDDILQLVHEYAATHPQPERPLYAPSEAGIHASLDPATAEYMKPEHYGNWFHMLLYNAGNAAKRRQQPQLAIELYKQALLQYSHPSVYNNIGSAYRQLGRYREARRWFEQAIARDRDFLRGYLRCACVILLARDAEDEARLCLAQFRERGGTPEQADLTLQRVDPEHRPLIDPLFREFFPELFDGSR